MQDKNVESVHVQFWKQVKLHLSGAASTPWAMHMLPGAFMMPQIAWGPHSNSLQPGCATTQPLWMLPIQI